MPEGEDKQEQVSLVIRMDGTFDLAAARQVLQVLEKVQEGGEVYVDLTHVRDFHDGAVALLADALVGVKRRVYVRGLRQHQYRMLRYLGVPPSALDPGLAPRPSRASSFESA
jgi:ABC-type transporter Mla MlaB component